MTPSSRQRDYPETPLTEQERKEVREMIEHHRRAKWLWGSLHRLAIAIGAVAGAIAAIKTFLWPYIK